MPVLGRPALRQVVGGLALATLIAATVGGIALATDGAQVDAGRSAYQANFAVCHGSALGGGQGPALSDPGLHNRFPTALRLYQFMRSNMPLTGVGPGGLSDTEYLAITAFVVESRGVGYSGLLTTANAADISLAPPDPTAPTPAPPMAPTPIPTPSATPTPAATGNTRPQAPTLLEPGGSAVVRVISPYFGGLLTSPFVDADSGDRHTDTEFEIREFTSDVRVWSATVTRPPLDQASLVTGSFEGPLAGRMALKHRTIYAFRARHRDASGDPATGWSERSRPVNRFTAQQGLPTPLPLRLRDIQPSTFTWVDTMGDPVTLPPGNTVLITGGTRHLHRIKGAARGNLLTDFAPADRYVNLSVQLRADAADLVVPASTISLLDAPGARRTFWMPFMRLEQGRLLNGATGDDGSFYFEPDEAPIGSVDVEPLLITRTRTPQVPWRVPAGFRVELVAGGLTLPVQLAGALSAADALDAPLLYVTELHGRVLAVGRDGSVWTYADEILNFTSGDPPAQTSGQLGTSGIAVDPASGDVYVTTTYRTDDGFHNKVVRFESDDGGRTAARRFDILRMESETTGASHQIHGALFGNDGMLYIAVGNGFSKRRGLDDRFYGGKILRLNRDGSAPTDNPRFDPNQPEAPIIYQWAKGLRNDFALAQRPGDDALYTGENGPAVDRLLRVQEGGNYGFDGTDASILTDGVWFFGLPAISLVGVAFATGGAFPPERQGNLYMGAHGFNFVEGTAGNGKEIWEFRLNPDGTVRDPPTVFVKYVGNGFATVTGVAYLPEGLNFVDLYADHPPDNDPVATGARLWRAVADPTAQPR